MSIVSTSATGIVSQIPLISKRVGKMLIPTKINTNPLLRATIIDAKASPTEVK